MNNNKDENTSGNGKTERKSGEGRSRPSDLSRYAALTSTPYIVIVFPLVGFGIGWLPVHFWNWPAWFPVITLVLGLVQGMREVYKIGQKIDEEG